MKAWPQHGPNKQTLKLFKKVEAKVSHSGEVLQPTHANQLSRRLPTTVRRPGRKSPLLPGRLPKLLIGPQFVSVL